MSESSLVTMLGKNEAEIELGGSVRKIYPLDLNDVADLEKETGKSIQDIGNNLTVEDMRFIIWLGIRKTGLSINDIDAEHWNTSPRQVGRWVGMSKEGIQAAMEIVKTIFKMSGFGDKKNPTPAPGDGGKEQNGRS